MTGEHAEGSSEYPVSEGLASRFWAKVDKRGADECWPWKGVTDHDGYGRLRTGSAYRKRARAPRISWLLAYGAIPVGLLVCHHCDNPPCCNPAHLWLGTVADNAADMLKKGRDTIVGERNSRAKITAGQVRAIRAEAQEGARFCDIAPTYGISPCQVGKIVNRQNWRSVP